jgi:hypothetical protein
MRHVLLLRRMFLVVYCHVRKTITGANMNAMRQRNGRWIKDGKGTISTDSGVLAESQYSLALALKMARNQSEELIAAAHAGCSHGLVGSTRPAGLMAVTSHNGQCQTRKD